MDSPDDADGDGLRRLASDGSDLSQQMDIDFAVAVPDEETGQAVARLTVARGYRSALSQDEETGEWTCSCSRFMVPSYEAVLAAQAELDELARPVGGYADGLGSFGNAG